MMEDLLSEARIVRGASTVTLYFTDTPRVQQVFFWHCYSYYCQWLKGGTAASHSYNPSLTLGPLGLEIILHETQCMFHWQSLKPYSSDSQVHTLLRMVVKNYFPCRLFTCVHRNQVGVCQHGWTFIASVCEPYSKFLSCTLSLTYQNIQFTETTPLMHALSSMIMSTMISLIPEG